MKEHIGYILLYLLSVLAIASVMRSFYVCIRLKNIKNISFMMISFIVMICSFVVTMIYRLDKNPPKFSDYCLIAFFTSFILILLVGYFAEKKYRISVNKAASGNPNPQDASVNHQAKEQ